MQIEDGPKLVLLATNRESYGHISALITRGRMRAEKGSYRLTLADLEQNLDHCLALLIPGHQPRPEQARYIAKRFPPRAWIGKCGF